MDCYRHPGLPVAEACISCGQGVCPSCRELVAGHPMCAPCVQAAQAELGGEPVAADGAPPVQPASPWTGWETAPASPQPAPGYGEPGPTDALDPETPSAPVPAVAPGTEPGILRRLGRGWAWGIVYGQWWTLWSFLSAVLWGRVFTGRWSVTELVAEFFVYAFFGSCTGILIALAKARENAGGTIGVAVGVGICLLLAALTQSPGALLNLIFFYFTGRYVGAGLSGRVMRPVGGGPAPGAGAAPAGALQDGVVGSAAEGGAGAEAGQGPSAGGIKGSILDCCPTEVRFLPVDLSIFPELDTALLARYTHDLMELGFRIEMDFTLHSNARSLPGPGFGRLFSHPEHHCLAEVNQIFPKDQPATPVRVVFMSLLEDGWQFSTTDRKSDAVTYMLRRPRSLWVSLPGKGTAELLRVHLERRAQIAGALGVRVRQDFTPERYQEEENLNCLQRREVVVRKSVPAGAMDLLLFNLSPRSEWMGDFKKVAARRKKG